MAAESREAGWSGRRAIVLALLAFPDSVGSVALRHKVTVSNVWSRAPLSRRAAPACAEKGGGSASGPDGTDGESDALAAFRKQLQRQMSESSDGSPPRLGGRSGALDLWASPMLQADTGVVLFADYSKWHENAKGASGAPFEQFALRGPIPQDLPPDMVARVLPVVIVVSQAPDGSHEALLLERRTGILLGDIKGDEYACAPINALMFGGVAARENVVVLAQHDGPAAPTGFTPVFTGVSFGPWKAAKELIEGGKLVGGRTMIFAGKTVFAKGELEQQMSKGYWKAARLSRDLLFKERSEPSMRKGSKPFWREGLELCEGEHAKVVETLYGDEL